MADIEQDVIDIMKACGIDIVLTLPCDKIKNLLAKIPRYFKEIPMTREENGMGIAAGLYLAGKKPAMLIQSTGIGNSINALSSLHMTYKIPLPILASWRGVYKEGILAQEHFGGCLPCILDGTKLPYATVGSMNELSEITRAIKLSYESNTPVVALLSPRIWGASTAPQYEPNIVPQERKFNINCNSHVPKATQTRYEMIKGIAAYIKGKIVVSNIGVPSKELYAACDQDSNFYMLGSLGLATSIGTGLAMSVDTEVIVLDGDGSLLMNPNALGSAAQEHPENLTIIAFDNSANGSTGNQPTYSSSMDLELLAKVYGIKNTSKVSTADELLKALKSGGKGPRFIHAIILAKNADVPNIPMTPVQIKERFMAGIRPL